MRRNLYTLFALVIIVVVTGCDSGQTEPTSDNTNVEMTFAVEPEPPAIGAAEAIVTLSRSDGTPINGATVRVHADMDHEGMMPVDAETTESTDGVYRVPLTWTMGGGWIIEVTAVLPGGQGTATGRFEQFVETVSRDSIINQSEEQDSESQGMEGMNMGGD